MLSDDLVGRFIGLVIAELGMTMPPLAMSKFR